MIGLGSLSAGELAVLALVVGLFSAKLLNSDELNVVGNFVVAIGGIMLTIAAQEQFLASQEKPDVEETLEELQQQVAELEEKLKTLNGAAVK